MNGEKPLSPELLTERLAALTDRIDALEVVHADIRAIRESQQAQALNCARVCASNGALFELIRERMDDIEGDVEDNRKRINNWGTGNTVLSAIFATIAGIIGGTSK